MTAGDLKVVAITDLGGLGASEGPPTTYYYSPPSAVPLLAPWLAVLSLFFLQRNRVARAWWIMLPLGIMALLEWSVQAFSGILPDETVQVYPPVFGPLPFALAALWLLSPYLTNGPRWKTFLRTLLTLAGFTTLTHLCRQPDQEVFLPAVATLLASLLICLIISLALLLTGFLCRGGYRPTRITLWLAAWLLAACLVIMGPLCLIALIGGATLAPLEFLGAVLSMTGLMFAVQLPFLVLAFANSFHRQRLQSLLHLAQEAPPPIPAAPLPLPASAT